MNKEAEKNMSNMSLSSTVVQMGLPITAAKNICLEEDPIHSIKSDRL